MDLRPENRAGHVDPDTDTRRLGFSAPPIKVETLRLRRIVADLKKTEQAMRGEHPLNAIGAIDLIEKEIERLIKESGG